jgi:hypothetical protein
MAIADVIYLIAEDPEAHGVYEEVNETERMVYVTILSVGMTEAYTAMSAGLAPDLRFLIREAADYQGEKKCWFQGVLYDIIRTYQKERSVGLTVQRSNADV